MPNIQLPGRIGLNSHADLDYETYECRLGFSIFEKILSFPETTKVADVIVNVVGDVSVVGVVGGDDRSRKNC